MSAQTIPQWDGRTWFVEEPEGFPHGLYNFSQIEAHHLLKNGSRLSEWEARFLQTIFYQCSSLTAAQEYWLDRIGRRQGASRVAA